MPEPTTDHAAALADAVRLVLEGKASAGDRERVLLGDLRQSRIKLKRANETIDALTARVPADGALVIPKEDAAGLDLAAVKAFTALNLKPDELVRRLKEGDEARASVAEAARVKAITDAVAEHGWNAPLLAKLASPTKEGFTVSLTEQTVDGKKVPVPVAQKLGADGKADGDALPLEEFATKHLAEYGAALKASSTDATKPATRSPGTPAPRAAGAPFHTQSGAGAAGGVKEKPQEERVAAKRARYAV